MGGMEMSENLYEKAKSIIDTNIEKFLERINSISEIGPAKKIRRNTPGFAILQPGNKEYYEYEYYAISLEWYIRDFLINQTLQDLFQLYYIPALWPDLNGQIYVRFSNESIESIFPFEFIIDQNGSRTGYRYTQLIPNETEDTSLLKQYELDKIYIIDWKTDDVKGIINTDENNVYRISAEYFLEDTFDKRISTLFLEKATSAVKNANQEIGFQTIPRFSLRYLSSFKEELERNLLEIDYRKLRYDSLNSCQKESYGDTLLSNSDYDILDRNYKGKGLYKALIGRMGFAKCFLTAEYLYYIFKDGNFFDYTSVISGYLKSVEQLIYEILNINLSTANYEDNFWIKKGKKQFKQKSGKNNDMLRENPNTKRLQIRFLSQNKKYFDISLAPMIWFLKDNNRYHISEEGITTVHTLLLQYRQECRNEHFHKDNIESFEEVKAIRNNTYLLIYFLLGGCKLLETEDSKNALGIINNRYEQLYKRIIEIPKSVRKYIIKFPEQEEKIVYRLIKQDKPKYDPYGFLILSNIKFISADLYTDIEDEDEMIPDIIIDKENIPEKIWYLTYSGKKVLIEW